MCSSRWPRGQRRGSAAVRLLGLSDRIPPGQRGLPLVSVLCSKVGVPASGRSLFQRSPTECDVCECDLNTSTRRRLRPTRAAEPGSKKGDRARKVYSETNKQKKQAHNVHELLTTTWGLHILNSRPYEDSTTHFSIFCPYASCKFQTFSATKQYSCSCTAHRHNTITRFVLVGNMCKHNSASYKTKLHWKISSFMLAFYRRHF